MFKNVVRYGLAISCLALPFLAQANPCTGANAKCDLTFSTVPTFSNLCVGVIQGGTYTIHNNTPAIMDLNYIRIQDNDPLPGAATAIVTAPTNNCGTTLASGAYCNITLNLQPLATGTYNRVLQVGISGRQVQANAPAITSVASNCPTPPPTPPAPDQRTVPGTPDSLYEAAIIAGSTITNTGPSVITGDVDLAPGTSITGFPPGTIASGSGSLRANDGTAVAAKADATTYFNALNALPCGTVLTGQDLGARTLAPGVYCFSSSAQLTGALTLSGAGDYVFQIGSTLTTASNSSVTLTNGATNSRVNWAIGSSATLGTGTALKGIIAAYASITFNTSASLIGRAWAGLQPSGTGSVTLDTNIINPTL